MSIIQVHFNSNYANKKINNVCERMNTAFYFQKGSTKSPVEAFFDYSGNYYKASSNSNPSAKNSINDLSKFFPTILLYMMPSLQYTSIYLQLS